MNTNNPQNSSEYLNDLITKEKQKQSPTKTIKTINWKHLLVLLLPFGTLILLALLVIKKLNLIRQAKFIKTKPQKQEKTF